jgi:hypothetical protein
LGVIKWEPSGSRSGSRLKTGAEVGAGLTHQFSDIKPPLLNQQPRDIRYLHSLISVLLYKKRNLLMFLHCTQDIPACHPRSSIINVRDASKWCCELLGHRVSQHRDPPKWEVYKSSYVSLNTSHLQNHLLTSSASQYPTTQILSSHNFPAPSPSSRPYIRLFARTSNPDYKHDRYQERCSCRCK